MTEGKDLNVLSEYPVLIESKSLLSFLKGQSKVISNNVCCECNAKIYVGELCLNDELNIICPNCLMKKMTKNQS